MSVISLCGGVGANTGPQECDLRRGIPKLPILGSKAFTPEEYASVESFEAALVAATKLANGDANKLFAFPEIQNVVNNTEANVTGTSGLGLQFIFREGKPAYQFGVVIGSAQEKQLRKWNRKIVPAFMFDDNPAVWGRLDGTLFKGCRVQVFCTGKPWSDGSSVDSEYTLVTIQYQSAEEFFDQAAAVETSNLAISDLEGLIDLYGSEPVAHTTNAYKIAWAPKSTSLVKKPDIYALYADELAVASLWSAATGTGFGTDLPITSVAKDDVNKCWTMTLDSTAYTALPNGTKIQVKLDPPVDLEAADVYDVEAVPFIVTKS